ncbi:MAG: DUF4153 domain-containing protein [Flavobacterium sp.]
MSKFPSFQKVWHSSIATLLRFPLEVLVTIVGACCAFLMIRNNYAAAEEVQFVKIIMSCSLCLVGFLSCSLFFDAVKGRSFYRLGISLLVAALLFLFVFSFDLDISEVEIQQFFVLTIALHVLVSFAAFLPKKYNQEEFWEFNKLLFLRILTSGLYSGVLFAGLALAIVAVKELFSFDLDEKLFGYLFIGIAGPFNTLFFLNGIPVMDQNTVPLKLIYPIGLKKFTQYVLLPLISLYLVILLCYEAKILITLSLPIGWVSYLVLVFAIIGILSFLLVHPIANDTGNVWMKTFNRWFYYLLLPLLGLLFWAILYRIFTYGFTHERYYVLLLSLWLTLVVAYFLISKNPKIIFIPISLCLAGLFSIIGPQSADSVAKRSQLHRFSEYVQLLKKQPLSFEAEKDLSSIVEFLASNYTAQIMLPFAKEKLTVILATEKRPNAAVIVEALGANYRSQYDLVNANKLYFSYAYSDNLNHSIENIQGYDLSFLVSNYGQLECGNCVVIDSTSYSIRSIKKSYGIDLQINNDLVALPFIPFIEKTAAFDSRHSSKKITQVVETANYTFLITFLEVGGKYINGKKVPENYNLKMLLKIK